MRSRRLNRPRLMSLIGDTASRGSSTAQLNRAMTVETASARVDSPNLQGTVFRPTRRCLSAATQSLTWVTLALIQHLKQTGFRYEKGQRSRS